MGLCWDSCDKPLKTCLIVANVKREYSVASVSCLESSLNPELKPYGYSYKKTQEEV